MVCCSTLYSLFDLSNWLITQHCFIQWNSAAILQNILGVQCSTCKTFFLVLFSWSHLLTMQLTPHPSNKKNLPKSTAQWKIDPHLISIWFNFMSMKILLACFMPSDRHISSSLILSAWNLFVQTQVHGRCTTHSWREQSMEAEMGREIVHCGYGLWAGSSYHQKAVKKMFGHCSSCEEA